MQNLEQAIRERAYHLWMDDGCRDGNADAHWLVAQREVLASALGSFARVTPSDQAASARSGKSTKGKAKISAAKRKRRAA